jgi:hypothetical protein
MQRVRIRITIWSLQVAVFLVAISLSVRLYIEPRLYWRDVWILLFAVAFYLIVLWLILAAPWPARLAALGFVAGAIVEFIAMKYVASHKLILLTPGGWARAGWYPLAVPVERLIITRGWAVIPSSTLTGMFLGMALSGAAGCIIMLMVWSLWRAVCWQKAVTPRLSRRG